MPLTSHCSQHSPTGLHFSRVNTFSPGLLLSASPPGHWVTLPGFFSESPACSDHTVPAERMSRFPSSCAAVASFHLQKEVWVPQQYTQCCVWPLFTSLGSLLIYLTFFYLYIFSLFRERGREGEREGEKHQLVPAPPPSPHTPQSGDESAIQACALTVNWTSHLALCRTKPNRATPIRVCHFLEFTGWHWLITYKFQVYNSIVHHLCVALCAHHPKSRLPPSP